LLDHHVEVNRGEYLNEITYGFLVRNSGRTIARGMRAFVVKIEVCDGEGEAFRQISAHTYALGWHGARSDDQPTILVPHASVVVALAAWREDHDVIVPNIGGMEEYYEEVCAGAAQFRFTVATIEEGGEHAFSEFTIDNPGRRR
jgi:hypothetical protein